MSSGWSEGSRRCHSPAPTELGWSSQSNIWCCPSSSSVVFLCLVLLLQCPAPLSFKGCHGQTISAFFIWRLTGEVLEILPGHWRCPIQNHWFCDLCMRCEEVFSDICFQMPVFSFLSLPAGSRIRSRIEIWSTPGSYTPCAWCGSRSCSSRWGWA